MNQMTELEKRTYTIKRTFKAPIQLVWEAWTKAEHITNWWGPPGMEITVVKHDFHVGGEWEYHMLMPNGKTFLSEGVYVEIEAPNKLVTTANFRPMTEGVELHISLVEEGDLTHFTFNVVHPTEAYCKQQWNMGAQNGWGSVFDRLENLLSELSEVES
ncbi:MAG: SRPBCC domain-containing protein [Bacteroidota bacterium]